MRILILALMTLFAVGAYADSGAYYGPSSVKCGIFTGIVGFREFPGGGEGWLKDSQGTEYLVVSSDGDFNECAGNNLFKNNAYSAGQQIEIEAALIPAGPFSHGYQQLDLNCAR